MASNKTIAKARTKSETYQALCEATGLTCKQVASVFDHLAELIKKDLGKKAPGYSPFPAL